MRAFTKLGAVVLIAAFVTLALVAAFLAGSLRYGGPGELIRRIRVQVAFLSPHPEFVPTPLPTQVDRSGTTPIWLPTAPGSRTAVPTGTDKPVDMSVTPAPTAARSTPTSAPSPTPTVPPTPAHLAALPVVQLSGFAHVWQKWNNCAPATLSMCLSQFGNVPKQEDLALALKGTPDDKNVSPEEIAAYVESQGLRATVRVNGDLDRLRLFLSNGMPVMVESWLEEEPNNGMGHYRLVTGYDDSARLFTLFDSYVSTGVRSDRPYEGIKIGYDELLELWKVFNRTYILTYRDDQSPLVASILGADSDDATMWQNALAQARREVEQSPKDPFAWFNLGTDLVALRSYDEAATAYGTARVIGLPWRMLWYQFGPFEAYYETGLYEELLALANATIRTRGEVEEVYYWKGLGLAATGNMAEARKAWEQALEFNPRYADAANALTGTAQSPQKVSPPLKPAEDSHGG